MKKHFCSRFSSNSEAPASELLENPEEMFSWYYMDGNVISSLISSTTHWCATRNHKVNHDLELIVYTLLIFVSTTWNVEFSLHMISVFTQCLNALIICKVLRFHVILKLINPLHANGIILCSWELEYVTL